MSADGMNVAAGATCNRDNGSRSGHERMFACSSTTNKWNIVGSAIPGARFFQCWKNYLEYPSSMIIIFCM